MNINETASMDETDPRDHNGYYVGPPVDKNTGAILTSSGKPVSGEEVTGEKKKGKSHPSDCDCQECKKDKQNAESSRHAPSVPDDPQQALMGMAENMQFNEFEQEVYEGIDQDVRRIAHLEMQKKITGQEDTVGIEGANTRIKASLVKKKLGHHEVEHPQTYIDQVNNAARKRLLAKQGPNNNPASWFANAPQITDSINKVLPAIYESYGYFNKKVVFTPLGNTIATPFVGTIEESTKEGNIIVDVNGTKKTMEVSPLFKQAFVENNVHYKVSPEEVKIVEDVMEKTMKNTASYLFEVEYRENGLTPPKNSKLVEKQDVPMSEYVNAKKRVSEVLNEQKKVVKKIVEDAKEPEIPTKDKSDAFKPYINKFYPKSMKVEW